MQSSIGSRCNVRRLVGLLSLAVLIGFGALCLRAWHQTWLSEAYLPALQQAARERPYDASLMALLGARLAQARRYDEAARSLERAVALGEDNPELWLTWAATEAVRDERNFAWAILMAGMQHPQDAPLLQAALQRCHALPPNTTPLALATAISPSGPQSLVAHYTRGSFLNFLADWYGHLFPERSGYATRKAWALKRPGDPTVQRLWGEALLRDGRYAEAVLVLQRAYRLAPKSLRIHRDLADALYHEGDVGKAGLEYEACLKEHPNDLASLLGLGRVALDKHILQMAIDVFRRATTLAPHNPDAWIGLGRAYFNQQLDLGRSLQAYQQAVRLAPDRTDFYPYYADTLRATYHYREAEQVLRRRLQEAPYDARTYFLLAVTLQEVNVTPARLQEAEGDLRVAVELEPQNAAMLSALGRLLQEEGKAEQAIPFLETALKLDVHDVAATIALARACRTAGRMREAQAAEKSAADLTRYLAQVKSLQDAIQQHPEESILYRRLADLYLSGGEPNKAQNYLQAAELLEHNQARALQGLRALQNATFNTQTLNRR
ncbi:cytochrome c biogenesis factor [Chthonomonas calidirosea]|nr:cytochrome c biogenesis factor [Chthonomonas calidirosea]